MKNSLLAWFYVPLRVHIFAMVAVSMGNWKILNMKLSEFIRRLMLHKHTFGDDDISFYTPPLHDKDEWGKWEYCLMERFTETESGVILSESN
jgi:hypothetical protein